MLKKYSNFIIVLAFLGTYTKLVQADESQTFPLISNQAIDDQETQLNQDLYHFLKNLDPENIDLLDLIKAHFDTDNQEVINFIAEQTDHVNLALSIFKKHFTNNEIQQILDFHTSVVGQKFGVIFPSVMQDYKQALEDKMQAIKAAIIAYAKEQQTTV